MKKVLYAVNSTWRPTLFHPDDERRIARAAVDMDVLPPENGDKAFLIRHLREAEVVITSWDTAALDQEVMSQAPHLKLLLHAAGSVKPVVSDALWERGVRVSSAAAAISYGVAEFCLGLILTATKRAFWAGLMTRQGQWQESLKVFHGPHEIYKQNIGVIGASHVGRQLIRLLRNFECSVWLYDPFVTPEKAAEMGVHLAPEMKELFAGCSVVSVNAPLTSQTHQMIRGEHFRLLPKGALFINTARGAIVHEDEMIRELRRGEFVACLDVTDPEPPRPDNPLRQLPNVWLTPHEAGVVAQNRLRIGTLVADELLAYVHDQTLRHEVTREQLARIG